ncbi:MAG: hypothetical protein WD875_18340 [Pirellulales bacterium]
MSRRKKTVPKRTAAERTEPTESRAAEALTSMWMLSAVNALVAQAVWIGLRFYIRGHADAKIAALLAGLLLIVAAALSIVVLVLTPIVHRVRQVRPPPVVTLMAIVIALGPWAAILTLAIAG